MEFNFLPYEHGTYENYFTPYVLVGFSVFKYNPKTDLRGETYNLRDFGTEGQTNNDLYRLVKPAFVYGLGLKWDINYNFSLNIEIASHSVFTDYLDDVSGTYPNQVDLLNDRGQIAVDLSDRSLENDLGLGEEGRQRGNGKDNDSFNFISVGVMYYFGDVLCPEISRIRKK
jgi:hypothetical protein